MARKRKITVEFFAWGTWVGRKVFGSWDEVREYVNGSHDDLSFDEYRAI